MELLIKMDINALLSTSDLEWVSKVRLNTQAVLKRAQRVQGRKVAKKEWQVGKYTADTTLNLCL